MPSLVAESSRESFDASKPLVGVVICCTSVPPDQRTKIAAATRELGGTHKYDLTLDVTHLIVGSYNTPKYRHVAKERPDIKAMAVGWIQAVLDLYRADHDFDFEKVESGWRLKTLESGSDDQDDPDRLVCCLTGFPETERGEIERMVSEHGGRYVGDLSKQVTHLIVCKPEGKKYQAARRWDIVTVSVEWLKESVERHMILDEKLYDPLLPVEERGKGAWIREDANRLSSSSSTGSKRARSGAGKNNTDPLGDGSGPRKLRKTASMRLTHQGSNIWDDMFVSNGRVKSITENSGAVDRESRSPSTVVLDPVVPEPAAKEQSAAIEKENNQNHVNGGIFDSCRFYVHNFPSKRAKIVCEHLSSHGSQISSSLDKVVSPSHSEPLDQRFVIVPQNSSSAALGQIQQNQGVHIVTEFYIERCLHSKQLFDPSDHVLGQPFPQFPIPGFESLSICTAGFKNEQLNQVEKAIVQLGATYSERLNKNSSVLVCPVVKDVRKQKLDFALFSKIPVVKAEWLWECIRTGSSVPWDDYMFPELIQRLAIDVDPDLQKEGLKLGLQRTRSEPVQRLQAQKKKSEFRALTSNSNTNSNASSNSNSNTNNGHKSMSKSKAAPVTAIMEDFNEASTTQPNDDAVFPPSLPSLDPGPLAEIPAHVVGNRQPPQRPQPHLQPQPQDQVQVQAPAPVDKDKDKNKDKPRQPLRRFPTGATVNDSDEDDDDTITLEQEIAEARRKRVAKEQQGQQETKKQEAEETLRRQKQQQQEEEEKGARKADEHRELRTSLINHINRPSSVLPEESGDLSSNHNSHHSNHASLDTSATSATAARPKRRKREVLGRAVSNVSATSSIASVESSAMTGADRKASSVALEDLSLLGGGGGKVAGMAEEDVPLALTQIDYDNPEARRHRAEVVERMMGAQAGGTGAGTGTGRVGGKKAAGRKAR